MSFRPFSYSFRTLFALLSLTLFCFSLTLSPAEALKHQPILPGLCGKTVDICPTPHIVKAKERRVVTYRLDQGTAAYPGFRQQALDVSAAWLAAIGVEAREVTEGTPDLWLTFPADSAFLDVCGNGAAACIQYWADPVMVYFRRALLYGDWKTAISHEGINGGHALGEGEQYFDSGEFRCDTQASYTVMSCGTGVWQPQAFDVDLVCRILGGCFQPLPPEWCCQQDYDGDGNADDGYYHIPTDTWYWDVLCRFRWTGAEWVEDKGCP